MAGTGPWLYSPVRADIQFPPAAQWLLGGGVGGGGATRHFLSVSSRQRLKRPCKKPSEPDPLRRLPLRHFTSCSTFGPVAVPQANTAQNGASKASHHAQTAWIDNLPGRSSLPERGSARILLFHNGRGDTVDRPTRHCSAPCSPDISRNKPHSQLRMEGRGGASSESGAGPLLVAQLVITHGDLELRGCGFLWSALHAILR